MSCSFFMLLLFTPLLIVLTRTLYLDEQRDPEVENLMRELELCERELVRADLDFRLLLDKINLEKDIKNEIENDDDILNKSQMDQEPDELRELKAIISGLRSLGVKINTFFSLLPQMIPMVCLIFVTFLSASVLQLFTCASEIDWCDEINLDADNINNVPFMIVENQSNAVDEEEEKEHDPLEVLLF